MKNAMRAVTFAFVLSVPLTLHSQSPYPLSLQKIDQGTRVRVQTGGSWREGSLARRLMLSRSDTVDLISESAPEERIPISSVRGLQILQVSSRASHFGAGALLGALLGAGVAFGAGQGIALTPNSQKGNNAAGLAVVGGVIGGLLGGVVGSSISARSHWKEVQLPGQ